MQGKSKSLLESDRADLPSSAVKTGVLENNARKLELVFITGSV
jgi:hypothetical protein